jgi:hypothetical protein
MERTQFIGLVAASLSEPERLHHEEESGRAPSQLI